MTEFDIIKTLDDWRWLQERDIYKYEISTYSFDTDFNNCKNEEEKRELAINILLAHHLVYICDRQMDFRFIFYFGGYVISKIMEDYLLERPNNTIEFREFINNHTYIYPNEVGATDYTHYLKAGRPNNENFMNDFLSKYDFLNENDGYVVFASRMTINDYFCIFRTLKNYKKFIDAIENSKTVTELAENLFDCTYKGVKSQDSEKKYISGKDESNFINIYDKYDVNIDENAKFENKKFDSKRLWCVIRDYLYNPTFRECLEIIVGKKRLNELMKTLSDIELPGDVWNNNPKFAKCVWGESKQKFKSSREVRKRYNKEEWGNCLPIHFDITFWFVPRMCSMDNCHFCPLAQFSKDPSIKDKFKKNWYENICHGTEGKYCTIALYATGIKHLCKGKGNCGLISNKEDKNGKQKATK